jgi:hypothetical protein
MNDIDLVREMRADTPPPTWAQLAPGRARLVAATSGRSRPRRRSLLIPAGATAVLAAAAAVVLALSGSNPAVRPAPPVGAPTTDRMTLTSEVLSNASVAVAHRHVQEPAHDRWFYTKFAEYNLGSGMTGDERATPPAAEANVYRALATIPGVSVEQGIKDAVGRPVIGIGIAGGGDQLLLAPTTYDIIGARTVSTGPTGSKPKGTVLVSMAWVVVAEVGGPGKR